MSEKKTKDCEWRKAQHYIAELLKYNGFKVWEERSIKSGRVDILAKREIRERTYYLVFEVKHYQKITSALECKFEEQLQSYLLNLIKREIKTKTINSIRKNAVFIGYLVLTNDYGIYHNRKVNWNKGRIGDSAVIEEIWTRNVYLFCSIPKHIQQNLEKIGLNMCVQTSIETFLNQKEDDKEKEEKEE